MGVSAIQLRQYDRGLGHDEENSVTTTPEFLLNPPAGATKAVIQVFDQNIIFRDDGGSPTATRGLKILAGDIFVYEADRETMKVMSARSETGTALVRVAYYG